MPVLKTEKEHLADAADIIRKRNAEIVLLKRDNTRLSEEHDTAEAIRAEIWRLAEHNPEPPAWISGKGGRIGMRGHPLTVWSDIHYGEVIDPDQVNGVNKYNSAIAKKRMFRL